jgi:hypothetical protein
MNKLLLIVAAAESLTGLVLLMWPQLAVRLLFGTEIAVCSTSRFGLTIRSLKHATQLASFRPLNGHKREESDREHSAKGGET